MGKGKHHKGLGPEILFKQSQSSINQLREHTRYMEEISATTTQDVKKLRLTMGELPRTPSDTLQFIRLYSTILASLFGEHCLFSKLLTQLYTITTRLQSAPNPTLNWELDVSNVLVYHLWSASKAFFSQRLNQTALARQQVLTLPEFQTTLYHIQSGSIPAPIYICEFLLSTQPPLNNPHTQQEHKGNDRDRSKRPPPQDNTNDQKKHRNGDEKTTKYHCSIPQDQKDLIDKCFTKGRESGSLFSLKKLRDLLGTNASSDDLAKHIDLHAQACQRTAIVGHCHSASCFNGTHFHHQRTPFHMNKDKLMTLLRKYIEGN